MDVRKNMAKKQPSGWLQGLILLLAGAVVGYLLLVLVYCLPVERMQQHLESCVDAFADGPTTLLKDDTGMWVDYLTDSMILAEAVYKGEESPWNQAAAVYSNAINAEGEEAWTLRKVKAALEEEQNGAAYARYWHGNLVYLKPLLFVFDYKDILTLNMLAQLLLMLWIAQLLLKRNRGYLLLPMALAFGMLTPVAMALCLQYMPCFYVMAIACVVMLRYPDFVYRHAGLFFLAIGMATCYLDFLTFPLITLGIPLVLYLLLAGRSWRGGVVAIVRSSFCWGIGYVVFWAEKWIIGSLVLGENLFADAWNSLMLRSSHETEGQELTYGATLQNNFKGYDLRIWKVLFGLLLAALVFLIVVRILQGKGSFAKDVSMLVPLLLVACMPFAWYFVTVNHSYIHYGYTHKELMITAWALSCAAAELYCRWRGQVLAVKEKGGNG